MADRKSIAFINNSILTPKTLSLMHDKQFSNSECLPGMGFGFIRSYRNGQEIIKHEGGLPSGYTTTLFLIPKENLGIYVATNSLNGIPFNFEDDFLNYFFPCKNNDFNAIQRNASKDYSKYEGNYRGYDGVAKTTIMKMAAFSDEDMEIKDNKDGTLTLNEFTQAKEKITTKLVEIKNGVFLREDGRGKFTFKFDNDGNVTYAFNDISINSFEKIKFYDQSNFIMLVLGISIIVFIINAFLFVVSFIKRKNKKYKETEKSSVKKAMKLVNIIIEVFNVTGALGTIILTIVMCLYSDFSLAYLLYFFLTLIIISTIMVLLSLVLLIYYLVNEKGAMKVRVYYIFLNIANLAFVWILYYFNFLGYKLY